MRRHAQKSKRGKKCAACAKRRKAIKQTVTKLMKRKTNE